MRFLKTLTLILIIAAITVQPADAQIQNFRSRNFVLHTDLQEDSANELLKQLETMLTIISRYWSAPNRKPIECFVAEDINKWPPTSIPENLRQVMVNRGITQARGIRQGRQLSMTATVYATLKFGTPKHEAVHAYCFQTFGTTGPVWYSEGMAEMGSYWKNNDGTVNVPPYIIQYLKRSPAKSLEQITAPGQKTGDSWQSYARRWALCHFLVNNRNYRDRFRTLGQSYMLQRKTSFKRIYQSMMPELEFEFDLFMKHLQTGYDVDKCSWDWKVRARSLAAGKTMTQKLQADRGWQPTKLKADKGDPFVISATGSWMINDQKSSADDSSIQLKAAIYDQQKLSEEFSIVTNKTFKFPQNGQLVLRCDDEWNSLNDNSGTLKLTIRPVEQIRDDSCPNCREEE